MRTHTLRNLTTPPGRPSGARRSRGLLTLLTLLGGALVMAAAPAAAATQSVTNPTPITIPDRSPADPYPSTITVSGLTGSITDVDVTLNDLTHAYPDDLDVLLVGPGGQNLVIMSDTGGSASLSGVSITLDDQATTPLPDQGPITTGSYQPTNISSGDAFPAPAPAPSLATQLATFNGTDPNGTWSLYIVDEFIAASGTLNGGWTLSITTTNSPPVATNDAYTTAEDTPLTVAAPGVLGNDTDPDGNTLTAAQVTGPAHGTVALNPSGSFTYTPAANYFGPDSFTYTASDGSTTSNTATVALTVTPVNDPPVAVNDAYTTAEDTPLSVSAPGVLGNDSDVEGSPLTAALTTGPAHGTLTLNPSGSFTYTPTTGFLGTDTVTYTSTDGTATSPPATVTLTVGIPLPACTITGTPGNDVLTGTPGDDVICGLAGNDTLIGLAGNDTLIGGPGTDALFDGPGNDLLRGDDGTDALHATTGNDTLYGGAGTDALTAQDGVSGNDTLHGGTGLDVCLTDPGDTTTSCP